ncbi:MAG: hypothetical protein K8S13_20050 [Desulfobacula sp.]|uniref:hypothetical protein n=1 Tax=Desulfobacula sp. TaxID=2593537 RepID=UPI0025C1A9B4|nr:hypothetical protein [Desulfobacula sp.]MCD4722131.1 hypothetical protein [Desulfobacula sp.]
MKDQNSNIMINAEIHNNSLCLRCRHNNEIMIHEKKITGFDPSNNDIGMYYFWWILNAIKPLFFKMPVENVQIEFTQECKDKFYNMFSFCYNLLKNTNEILKVYAAKKDWALANEHVLFFNVDENVNFKKIYKNSAEIDSKHTKYLDFDPGFNPVERKWEKTPPPLSVEEFIQYIKENKIQKIVSINHYLLEKYLDQGIYILALFKYLGLEYIIIDLDNYDQSSQGYLYKCFYNVDAFDRFSYAEFHAFWDKYYGMANVNRIVFAHEDKSGFSFQEIDEDYNIVIMSNSRIQDVVSMLNPIAFVLGHFTEGSFFEELALWYYSLRHMILSAMDFNEYERLNYNALLLRFAYNASQFVKYIVIDSIETERKIELYGDAGWTMVFPEHYKTYLDRQGIDNVFSKGRSLNLLMNWQLSWLETSAVIFEALNYRVPFLNHPAIAKTSSLKGMSHIEYHTPVDLNQKLDNIGDHLNEDLIQSINYLNSFCNDNMNFIVSKLHASTRQSSDNEKIVKELKEHDSLLQDRINLYMIQNYDFLRNSFNCLFIEPAQYDISQSKYFSKTFMQRLIHYAQNR